MKHEKRLSDEIGHEEDTGNYFLKNLYLFL
jgi:hypothetical protein